MTSKEPEQVGRGGPHAPEEAFPTSIGGPTAGTRSEGMFSGAGGLRLYYQRWAPVAESPRASLALVHGFGEHGGRYTNVVNRFVPLGYSVYALDHRGHGRSPGPRGHINGWDEFRDDVRAFLEIVRTEGPQPIFLYGHSLGGLIVLEYALHHPEGLAGVIATSPLLTTPAISPTLLFLARIMSRLWPACSMNSRIDISSLSRDPSHSPAADTLVHGRGSARLSTEINAAIIRTQVGAAEWKLPLLIVHGGDDRLVPATGSREFFEHVLSPDKEHHEYPGGYHELHNDVDRERMLTDVEGWLDRHVRSA